MMETCFRIFLFFANSYRRRINLAKAVYYYSKIDEELAKNHKGRFNIIRQNIREDDAYTPLVVQSSVADELTYSQIIEVMEYLDGRENEEILIYYFHKRLAFNSLILTFNSEIVRDSWTQQRKLDLLCIIEEYADDVLDYAEKTMKILEKRLKKRFWICCEREYW